MKPDVQTDLLKEIGELSIHIYGNYLYLFQKYKRYLLLPEVFNKYLQRGVFPEDIK